MARRRMVAVVGARAAGPAAIAAAEGVGAAIVGLGARVLCGGRDGVMAAVCRGARTAPGAFDGCTIGLLPGPDAMEANAWVDVAIPTGLGLARNVVLVQAADAVVAIGGGAGTLSEIALAWQLGRPICALDVGEGWSSQLAGGRVDATDRAPIYRATGIAEVVAWLGTLTTTPNALSDAEI